MLFLWELGLKVTGVEMVEKAVDAFSQSSGMELRPCQEGEGFKVHQSSDSRLEIVVSDFFTLSHPSLDHSFTRVWDRASLSALSSDQRLMYAKAVQRMLKKSDFMYLLTTIEYDLKVSRIPAEEDTLPPFTVSEIEVADLFAGFARVERLGETQVSVQLTKFSGMQVPVKDVVYLLTPA